jgi:mRNA interferase YafQ
MDEYEISYAKKFKSSHRKLVRSGRFDISKLDRIIMLLSEGKPLDVQCHDHALTGDWSGYRECHVYGDILLIYKVEGNCLALSYLGTHAQLFGM